MDQDGLQKRLNEIRSELWAQPIFEEDEEERGYDEIGWEHSSRANTNSENPLFKPRQAWRSSQPSACGSVLPSQNTPAASEPASNTHNRYGEEECPKYENSGKRTHHDCYSNGKWGIERKTFTPEDGGLRDEAYTMSRDVPDDCVRSEGLTSYQPLNSTSFHLLTSTSTLHNSDATKLKEAASGPTGFGKSRVHSEHASLPSTSHYTSHYDGTNYQPERCINNPQSTHNSAVRLFDNPIIPHTTYNNTNSTCSLPTFPTSADSLPSRYRNADTSLQNFASRARSLNTRATNFDVNFFEKNRLLRLDQRHSDEEAEHSLETTSLLSTPAEHSVHGILKKNRYGSDRPLLQHATSLNSPMSVDKHHLSIQGSIRRKALKSSRPTVSFEESTLTDQQQNALTKLRNNMRSLNSISSFDSNLSAGRKASLFVRRVSMAIPSLSGDPIPQS
ncbi:unnamed protein product [Bursaphelenchus okinawaensis]|uniref:Uncharacterized protein n=1 Tax=Bursaphelenchus okinawaensis TaxID=465554 RepID=A0A811KE41_9BILA|nr:unnamed protein product [Bursaphelenchus okinawaensis]CAG9101510.1 unnamed protein product [Bursaphelenchus okinawaensis]